MAQAGTPPPRTVIGDPSQADGLGRNCPVSSATSVAIWHHALSHEPPQGDQKLARQGSLLVIDRTRNIAQQLGFAQVELAFDMTAAFVDQFAAFELAENVLTLGIDE
jgi:hypothetical protein